MTFEELLDQVLALLQRRGRVAYRAVQRQFDLDDATFEDVKDALLYAHPELVADDGRGLAWTGAVGPTSAASLAKAPPPPAAAPAQHRVPLAYTPPHLAEKILAARPALQGERKQQYLRQLRKAEAELRGMNAA